MSITQASSLTCCITRIPRRIISDTRNYKPGNIRGKGKSSDWIVLWNSVASENPQLFQLNVALLSLVNWQSMSRTNKPEACAFPIQFHFPGQVHQLNVWLRLTRDKPHFDPILKWKRRRLWDICRAELTWNLLRETLIESLFVEKYLFTKCPLLLFRTINNSCHSSPLNSL